MGRGLALLRARFFATSWAGRYRSEFVSKAIYHSIFKRRKRSFGCSRVPSITRTVNAASFSEAPAA